MKVALREDVGYKVSATFSDDNQTLQTRVSFYVNDCFVGTLEMPASAALVMQALLFGARP